MNSLNQKPPEKMTSPTAEFPEHQNVDGNSWNNKSEPAKGTDSTTLEKSESPKIESLVEIIPSPAQAQRLRQNGKRLKLDDEYDSIEMACHLASEIGDDCDAFGRSVAAQLRQMTRMQKFIAQRLISEVCFRGQIQILQTSTSITNQTTTYQPQQVPVYPVRPPHLNPAFGRVPDYIVVQTPSASRHTNHVATAAPAQPYSNYVPLHHHHHQQPQQSDHSATPMNHMEDQYGVN